MKVEIKLFANIDDERYHKLAKENSIECNINDVETMLIEILKKYEQFYIDVSYDPEWYPNPKLGLFVYSTNGMVLYGDDLGLREDECAFGTMEEIASLVKSTLGHSNVARFNDNADCLECECIKMRGTVGRR